MLNQRLQLKLSQKLSPQQIQLMKLIQLPVQELEQRLSREIEENPALETGKENEEDTYEESEDYNDENINDDEINVEDYLSDDDVPDYKLKSNNHSADDEQKNIPFVSGISFNEFIKNQLQTFSFNKSDLEIAHFLVGSIDQTGYIRRELLDLVDDLAFTVGIYTDIESVEKILKTIHLLDPPGVGARNLREMSNYTIKEEKISSKAVNNAIKIIENNFDMFIKKHYQKIILKLNINEDDLKIAIKEIEKLNPKPGAAFSEPTKINSSIIPDFTIEISENKLNLTLNSRNAPELHVSNEYKNMLSGYKETTKASKSQKDAVIFIKQKLDAANGLLMQLISEIKLYY